MQATIILCNTNYFDCYIYLDIFVYSQIDRFYCCASYQKKR